MFVAKKQQQTCQALNLLKRAASIAIALPRTLPSLVFILGAKNAPKINTSTAPQPSKKAAGLSPPKKTLRGRVLA